MWWMAVVDGVTVVGLLVAVNVAVDPTDTKSLGGSAHQCASSHEGDVALLHIMGYGVRCAR